MSRIAKSLQAVVSKFTTPVVIHCILDSRIGGPHRYVEAIINGVSPEYGGFLVTSGDGEQTDVALLNWHRKFKAFYFFEVLVNGFLMARGLRKSKRSNDLVIHVHSVKNLAPLLAARLSGTPVIWHMHEEVPPENIWLRAGMFLVGKQLVRLLSVTHGEAESLRPVYGEVTVIPGAVDIDFWKRDDAQNTANLAIPENEAVFQIVTVGHLNPLKAADVLLNALMDGLEMPWRLIIIGERLYSQKQHAELLDRLLEEVSQIHGPDAVSIVGRKSPLEIKEILNQSDLFVLPSLSEACPIALLEAMAMELPCVASDVGDIRIMVGESQERWLLPPGEVPPLREAIVNMASESEEKRSELGRGNRQRILDEYSARQLGEKHLEVYRETFAG